MIRNPFKNTTEPELGPEDPAKAELRSNRAYMAKQFRRTVKWGLMTAGAVAVLDHVTSSSKTEEEN